MTRQITYEQLRAETGQEDVEFVCADGTAIPLASFLPASFALKVAQLASGTLDVDAEREAFLAIVDAIAGDQSAKLLDNIDLRGLLALMGQLYGMGLGESSASDASSQSDGNGSRPT